MRLEQRGHIDARRRVEVSGLISGDLDASRNTITEVLVHFEDLVAAGGLPPRVDWRMDWSPGQLNWSTGSYSYSWPSFPFGSAGLAVLVRMLTQRGIGKHGDPIRITGYEIPRDAPDAIRPVDEDENVLPGRTNVLPFLLELTPSGPWVNIQCELPPWFPEEVPSTLHRLIWTWGNVANCGGFQIISEGEGIMGNDEFGVGIDGPVVGDDFLEWHCLMTGVPVESLLCLVNVLARAAESRYSIKSVYLG